MDFTQALKTLIDYSQDHDSVTDRELDAARHVIVVEVSALCRTDTDGIGDWLAAGAPTGNETPESIAREWDDLSID